MNQCAISLDDRVALITGASRGFGLAIAQGFLAAGAKVLAIARAPTEEMRSLSDSHGSGRLKFVRGDVALNADCQTAVEVALEVFGSVDILINNAALGMNALVSSGARPERFWETPPEAYHRFFEVNAVAPFQMARLVVPGMVTRGWGRILNLTTGLKTMQRAGYTPYGPTKAALEAASVAWSEELSGTGVTVNVLIPGGPSRTRMITDDPSVDIADADLIEPAAVVGPAIWLSSRDADGFSGYRLVASRWRADLVPSQAARGASEVAGW